MLALAPDLLSTKLTFQQQNITICTQLFPPQKYDPIRCYSIIDYNIVLFSTHTTYGHGTAACQFDYKPYRVNCNLFLK